MANYIYTNILQFTNLHLVTREREICTGDVGGNVLGPPYGTKPVAVNGVEQKGSYHICEQRRIKPVCEFVKSSGLRLYGSFWMCANSKEFL